MKKTLLVITTLILIIAFCAEIFILKKYGYGSTSNKTGLILSIIGFYSIAIGFIKRSTIGKTFSGLLEDMTSPNAALFIAGNLTFMGLFLNLISIGFDKNRNANSSLWLGCFGSFLLLLILPLIIIYVIFHLVIILPLAYISYVISSALIETICGASGDIEMTQSAKGTKDEKLGLKNIINSDREASKSFLIGIPATVISFIVKIISIFNSV